MAIPYIPSYRDVEVTFSTHAASQPSKAVVHYVEAGNPSLPKIVLLHGFPSSSFQYRDFIPMLSDQYHVLAPDYPGFGLTKVADDFVFSFESITTVTAAWLKAIEIEEAVIFIQDFGAPVGMRLAITKAIRVRAIVSQNGNIYQQGLGQGTWGPLSQFWKTNSPEFRRKLSEKISTVEGTRDFIVKGTPEKDLHLIDPQAWMLPYYQNMTGGVNMQNKVEFLYDYRTNVELYPEFQKFLRDEKTPVLACWGKLDPSFIPAGATAFLEDSPDAVIVLLEAGHFALETMRWQIARVMRHFLTRIGY